VATSEVSGETANLTLPQTGASAAGRTVQPYINHGVLHAQNA